MWARIVRVFGGGMEGRERWIEGGELGLRLWVVDVDMGRDDWSGIVFCMIDGDVDVA